MSFESIQALFCASADRFGGRTAIEHGGKSITYDDLEGESNRLANYLLASGASKGTIVALLTNDVAAIVTGILGALKAGCIFFPCDPRMPSKRLKWMFGEAPPQWLLTESGLLDRVSDLGFDGDLHPRLLLTDGEDGAGGSTFRIEEYADFSNTDRVLVPRDPDDRCYIYFTSGSTGRPKGIVGRLKAIDHYILWEIETFDLGESVRVSQLTNPTFDAFLRDVFVPLSVGGTVCLPDSRELVLDAGELVKWIDRSRVSLVHCVPSLFRTLLGENLRSEMFPALEHVLLAGEVLFPEDVRRWSETFDDRIQLVNLYGPSETSMTKFCYRVEPEDKARSRIPIGKPMRGATALVIDDRGRPCAAGQAGEILIRTPYMTHGYHNRSELTDEVFIPNPFARDSKDLVYKTGDLGRILEDGNFEFLGRKDRQVKVRGIRIELDEIESCLQRHPAVEQVAVTVREDNGENSLCAYVVLAREVDSGELRDFLREFLPDYMIPSYVVFMQELPRTASGKIDASALPVPSEALVPEDRTLKRPASQLEELLLGIWSEILDLEKVSREDNFFEMGGHSLRAIQVVARVQKVLGVALPLQSVFEAPTVASFLPLAEKAIKAAGRDDMPALERVTREENPPPSFAQERLWFLDQLDPGNASYNIVRTFRIEGQLVEPALEAAFREFVRRHESQRTSFRLVAGKPVQVIAQSVDLKVPRIDLTHFAPEVRELELRRRLKEQAHLAFDLSRSPLIQVLIFRTMDEEHVVFVAMHHIASDGWSMRLLIREIAVLYQSYCQGLPSPLPELPFQYLDFAVWQRRGLRGDVLNEELAYWREQLAGISSTVLALPTDHARPPVQSYRGAKIPARLPMALAKSLAGLSRREGVTLYMTVLAALQTLLHLYSGQDDILVSSPIANRNHVDTEKIVGFFANSLVLHAHFSGEVTFLELLEQVRKTALGAYAHQDLPFEKLVQELQPERDLTRTPLFQAVFIFDEEELPPFELPGLTWTPLELRTETSKFDLTLSLRNDPEGLIGSIEYATDLFDVTTIRRMQRNFEVLLQSICVGPERKISALPIMTAPECHQLAVEWNDTRVDFPPASSIHGLFERRAASQGEAVAVIHKEQRITYRELDRRADRLAQYLRSLGVGPEVRVGLCVGRGAHMVLGALGILKAGGAYVPLDPTYPRDRIAFMLDDADMSVVVSQRRVAPLLDGVSATIVCLDEEQPWAHSSEERLPGAAVSGGNLAYVLYTSGSTGRPKGVSLTHANAVNLIYWAREVFDAEDLGGMVASTSICFDVSVFEMFSPLGWGGKVVIVRDPLECASEPTVAEGRLLCTVPSATAELARQGLPATLHKFFLGGEGVPNRLVQSLYEEPTVTAVLDGYGPSEDTTYTTSGVVARGWSNAPPIGRPASNKQTHILGRRLVPAALGVVGELCIGGAGQVRGYLKRPRLTAEKFVPDPLAQEPGRRLYRTGDLSRFLQDGRIDFLGRVDHQVKVRGFRIELGEIEETLVRHQAIRETVVMAHGNGKNGNQSLVAYVVPHNRTQIPPDELRQHLRKSLPDYMLPSTFVMLDEFPRTPSGKVNRKVLPSPDSERPDLTTEYVAPQSEAEQVIATIWQEVLERDKVGIYDNFFDLGGHSLLLLRVQEQVQQHFSIDVPITAMFKHTTISSLTEHVLGGHGEKREFRKSLERAAKKHGVRSRRRQRAKEVRSR